MTSPTVGFSFDPSQVTANLEVLQKGEYEFEILTKKSFLKQSGADKHDSYGVRYTMRVTLVGKSGDQNAVGKKVIFSTYYQSEGGQSMAKQFLMAALGYGKSKAEEERFNREQLSKDWNFDPNEGTVGDGYNDLDGARVIGQLDVQPNINDATQLMQNFKGWRSITSGPLN